MLEEQRLPVLNFNRQYINNTKIARIISTKKLSLDVSNQQCEIEIKDNIINLIDIQANDKITLSDTSITQYDMAVMDATYTIMCQGQKLITPEWILKVMSGNKNQWFNEKKLDDVKASIIKLQSIRIKIDCTDEYNAYHIKKGKKPVDSWTYESYLLPFGKIEAKYETNGKFVTAYTVLEKPALYRYAEMNHQIIDVPAYLFETQRQFSDTDEAILIKRYVIKRVAQIVKANNLDNNKISFSWYDKGKREEKGLFVELGYKTDDTTGWRKKKLSINNVVKGTLQTLVDCKAVSSFKAYRKDGTNNPASPIAGYKICFNPESTILQ